MKTISRAWRVSIVALTLSWIEASVGQNAPAAAAGSGDTPSVQAPPLTPERFLRLAMWSGQREIHLADLALRVANDELVRTYARELIRDHTAANRRIVELARAHSVVLPSTNKFSIVEPPDDVVWREQKRPTNAPIIMDEGVGTRPSRGTRTDKRGDWPLGEPDIEDVRRIHTLTGAAFEHAFIGQMVRDHWQTLRLFEGALELEAGDLARFARETLPIIRRHFDRGMRLAGRTGGEQMDPADSVPRARRSRP